MDPWPIKFWNEWAIQVLVPLSFMLQIFLLMLAGIRRREASTVLRALLWLAYQLADTTAIYALGHLSLSIVPREHGLVVFWAPFLLLHLGGPDNITAYSLEDSKLWKRHLLTVLIQVLGVVYVLYKQVARSSGDMILATILMFVVGVVKYSERTWALWSSNMSSIRSSLESSSGDNNDRYTIPKGVRGQLDEQALLEVAHSLFHFCKLKLVDSAENMEHPDLVLSHLGWNDTWKLMEMELSLLYDILYTKAAVIHTWFGYCIRFTTPFATAYALLLFHWSNNSTHDGQSSGVDVAITYALFAGAIFMEISALLAAIGSTWTLAFLRALPPQWSWLRHGLACSGRWHRLHRLLAALGWQDVRGRRWSGNIGQYNLLDLCTHDKTSPLSKLTEMPLLNDMWNKFHYSRTFEVTESLKKLVFDRHKKLMSEPANVNALGLLRKMWGKKALENNGVLYDKFIERDHLLGAELQEGILIWHIATEVFLANRKHQDQDDSAAREVVVAIKALSDYMMFLLVRRPYLLPGLVLHRMYEITCDNLKEIWLSPEDRRIGKLLDRREQLAKELYTRDNLNSKPSDNRVQYGVDVAKKLIDKEKAAEGSACKALLDVWMDFVSYTANKCSRESYAMKLSNGGELTVILWLMAAHFQPHNQISSGP